MYLSHFYKTRKYVEELSSGDVIKFDDKGCIDEKGNRIIIFSASFKQDMKKHTIRGYKPLSAKVNHILFWKQEDRENETLIVLPQLEFIKDNSSM